MDPDAVDPFRLDYQFTPSEYLMGYAAKSKPMISSEPKGSYHIGRGIFPRIIGRNQLHLCHIVGYCSCQRELGKYLEFEKDYCTF